MMTDHEKTVGTIGFQMPSDGEDGYGQRANVWIHITLSDDNAADLAKRRVPRSAFLFCGSKSTSMKSAPWIWRRPTTTPDRRTDLPEADSRQKTLVPGARDLNPSQSRESS